MKKTQKEVCRFYWLSFWVSVCRFRYRQYSLTIREFANEIRIHATAGLGNVDVNLIFSKVAITPINRLASKMLRIRLTSRPTVGQATSCQRGC